MGKDKKADPAAKEAAGVTTPDPEPRVPEWESWDDAVAKAGAIAAETGKPDPRRRACLLLVRAVGEKSIKPFHPAVLVGSGEDTVPGPQGVFAYLLPLRVPPSGVGGYFTVVFGDGESFVFRVLKFKAEADGGNDYVPVDYWKPVAPIT